jgi:hypothetical protein
VNTKNFYQFNKMMKKKKKERKKERKQLSFYIAMAYEIKLKKKRSRLSADFLKKKKRRRRNNAGELRKREVESQHS